MHSYLHISINLWEELTNKANIMQFRGLRGVRWVEPTNCLELPFSRDRMICVLIFEWLPHPVSIPLNMRLGWQVQLDSAAFTLMISSPRSVHYRMPAHACALYTATLRWIPANRQYDICIRYARDKSVAKTNLRTEEELDAEATQHY